MDQKKIVKDDDVETYKTLKEFYFKNDWDLWKCVNFDRIDVRNIGFNINQKISDTYKDLIKVMSENQRIKCFGGETDFNFSGKLRKRYFEYFLKDEKSLKEFQICKKMTFDDSCCNFSIMFSKGNLQCAKQKLGNDRFDVFLYMLERYLNKNDQCLLVAATAQNVKCLIEYLKLFENVYDYAHKVYLLRDNNEDNKLIYDLIESGKQAIDSEKRIKEYMELATRYWSARKLNCSLEN